MPPNDYNDWIDRESRQADMDARMERHDRFCPPPEEGIRCSVCNAVCTLYFMCDETPFDVRYCPKCFPLTMCGRGLHSEDCPTTVVEMA